MGAKDLAELRLADWPKMEGDVFVTSPRGKRPEQIHNAVYTGHGWTELFSEYNQRV